MSDSATPWTVAYQAPTSMGLSRQDSWSGWPFPSPGDLPNSGIKPGSPALQADSLLSEPPGNPLYKMGMLIGSVLKGCSEAQANYCVLVAQSYPTLHSPMNCSLPGSSVHGILQAIVLERIAISFSRGSSQS